MKRDDLIVLIPDEHRTTNASQLRKMGVLDDNRIGDFCTTFAGKRYYVYDPRVEDICIEDIAHALSMNCRFGGHCLRFYSVAQHSVFVSKIVEKLSATMIHDPTDRDDVILASLFHDGEETYMLDIPRPIKMSPAFDEYRNLARMNRMVVYEKFDIWDWFDSTTVKKADEIALACEARDNMPKGCLGTWTLAEDPRSEFSVDPVGPEEAEKMFLERFDELWRKTHEGVSYFEFGPK